MYRSPAVRSDRRRLPWLPARAGWLAALVALLAAPRHGFPVSGDIDPSFGHDGVVFTELGGSFASALVRQADGKLVAAGYAATPAGSAIAVARYDANGAPDPTF